MYDFLENCDIFLPGSVKIKVKNSQKAGKKPEEDGDRMPLKAPLIKSNHDRLPTIPYQKSDYIYIYVANRIAGRQTTSTSRLTKIKDLVV